MTKVQSSFLIGTSGWSYADWREKFYPSNLSKKDWFTYYTEHFNIVEVNATFYRWFPENIFVKWYHAAPKGFLYIIKVPRIITHLKKLIHCKKEINQFCDRANLLQDKLGLILMQLPPSMPYDLERLHKALVLFDHPEKVVVEFRHPEWINADTKNLLEKIGCIYCDTDSPIIKLQSWITSNIGYIRLHGRTKWFDYNYSISQLKNIATVAINMKNQGAKKIFILFNNDYHANAPKNASYLKKYLDNYISITL